MVQNGKLAACALADDRQLKSVDLPTFGRPTIPAFNAMVSIRFCYAKHYMPRMFLCVSETDEI